MKDPAFLFYFQDFAWGTRHMSYEDKGRYIDLLCEQADKGSIEESLFEEICANRECIRNKFLFEEHYWYNERLCIEMNKRKEYAKSRRNNRLGKKHVNNTSKSYDKHMENENEDININITKSTKPRTLFQKPKIEEILAYCQERKNSVGPQSFYDFYESKGWMIGKNKMKDWKAAVRTWERNNTTAQTSKKEPPKLEALN